MSRKIVVDMTDGAFPKVVFDGGYVSKRDLDTAIKAVKREHRKTILEYRRKKIIEDFMKMKGKVDGQASESGVQDSAGAAATAGAAKAVVGSGAVADAAAVISPAAGSASVSGSGVKAAARPVKAIGTTEAAAK